MTDETLRSIDLTLLEKGVYRATNTRGGTLVLGQGGTDESAYSNSFLISPNMVRFYQALLLYPLH